MTQRPAPAGRSAAESTAAVFGLVSVALYAALKLVPRLTEPGDLPLDEGLHELAPYLLLGAPLILTCLGTVAALLVAVLQRGRRVRASTWLLALPAVVLCAHAAATALTLEPLPGLEPVPVVPAEP